MKTATFSSGTQLPDADKLPSHVAIIMDGNGRWAKKRFRPRYMGHKVGVEVVENLVEHCSDLGLGTLTLFAFSSENWKRPSIEVRALMELFTMVLSHKIEKFNRNNVRLRFIGDRSAFPEKLHALMDSGEERTAQNTGLTLVIAANYGGHWDILKAARGIAEEVKEGNLLPDEIDDDVFRQHLSLPDISEPDLFIRTGGEKRISNFLLWQLAYTELYFCDVLWPDFSVDEFNKSLIYFSQRQRRFGKTGDQVEQQQA